MKTEQVYTIREAAKLLAVHPQTLRRWAESGKLNLIELPNNRHRITASELRRLTQGQIEAASMDDVIDHMPY